jgi:hypothetical protein
MVAAAAGAVEATPILIGRQGKRNGHCRQAHPHLKNNNPSAFIQVEKELPFMVCKAQHSRVGEEDEEM